MSYTATVFVTSHSETASAVSSQEMTQSQSAGSTVVH